MMTAAVPGTAALVAVPLLHEPLSTIAGLGLIFVTFGMIGAVFSLRKADEKQ
jgi:threonine/homoserine efflux transporter RhtA